MARRLLLLTPQRRSGGGGRTSGAALARQHVRQLWSTTETSASPPRRPPTRPLCRRPPSHRSSAAPRSPRARLLERMARQGGLRPGRSPAQMCRIPTRRRWSTVASSSRTRTTFQIASRPCGRPTYPRPPRAATVRWLGLASPTRLTRRRTRRPTPRACKCRCFCRTMRASGRTSSRRALFRRLLGSRCTRTMMMCPTSRSRGAGADWRLRRMPLSATAISVGSQTPVSPS